MNPDTEPQPSTLQVGPWRITQIREARAPFLEAARVFPQLDPTGLTRALDRHGDLYATPDRARLIMTSQGYLIQGTVDGRPRTLLVDTCAGGPKPHRRPPLPDAVSPWLTRLIRAGVRPDEVDVVISTHLHHDHVGGNTTLDPDGVLRPTFANARHLVARAEYEPAAALARSTPRGGPAEHVHDSVFPLETAGLLDLLDLLDGDAVVGPGIRLIAAPGHTPGHSIVEVTGGDRPILIIGDLIHHPLQIDDPDVSVAMCADPHASARTRARVLADAARTGAVLLAAHLPLPLRVQARAGEAGFDHTLDLGLLAPRAC